MEQATPTPKTFVVVPAYNEGEVLASVLATIRAEGFPCVVVDDGSHDDTYAIASAQGCQVLRHIINRGQGAALRTGIEFCLRAGAEVIVTFDSDGQHRINDVWRMLDTLRERRVDVVLGSRFLAQQDGSMPRTRRLVLKLGILFTRLTSGLRLSDTHNGLRVLSRRAAKEIRLRQDRMAHASELLEEIGRLKLSYCEVATTVAYTPYSKSKGQSSGAALRIVWELLMARMGRERT
ncbi:MAG: glycosyltransferase family 2 protein [Oxalobacteraceae bacterium]|nr:MAG: glycosyltransferase family 2 protein [Oxalobacteraceae bacterium]